MLSAVKSTISWKATARTSGGLFLESSSSTKAAGNIPTWPSFVSPFHQSPFFSRTFIVCPLENARSPSSPAGKSKVEMYESVGSFSTKFEGKIPLCPLNLPRSHSPPSSSSITYQRL